MAPNPIPFPGETLHGPAPRPGVITNPQIRPLATDRAYDMTQTSDEIRDGDVLFVPGVAVGVMVEAWPVIVAGDAEATGFHTLKADANIRWLGQQPWGRLFSYRYFPPDGPPEGLPAEEFIPPRGGKDYSASFVLARNVARLSRI